MKFFIDTAKVEDIKAANLWCYHKSVSYRKRRKRFQGSNQRDHIYRRRTDQR